MTVAATPDRALDHPHARDRIIVGYKPAASRIKRTAAVGSVAPATVDDVSPIATDTVVVELPLGRSVGAAIDEISGQPGVAYVEPDYRVRIAASADDSYYSSGAHWGMYGDGTSPHANPYGTGAGEAWVAGHTGAPGVYVGIIDEGIQTSHPELAPNIWSNPWETLNDIDDDGNGYVDDINGWDFYHDDASVFDGSADDHGTHVAGTVGARGGNGAGVAGVNWRVTLISAKFLGADGGYISDAIGAIDYVTDLKIRHGLEIVATNNSWSSAAHSQALVDAIERAGDAGILFVAAAGNDGRDIDTQPVYPAANRCVTRANGSPRGWDCIITVANLRSDGTRNSLSNRGSVAVDLAAPGSDIISTVPHGAYKLDSGTSMAAPHVAGAVALCASLDASLTPHQIRDRIMSTAMATASMAGITVSGGRLDIGSLADSCLPGIPEPTPTPVPTPMPTSTPAPTPDPPAGEAVIVDELGTTFRKTGAGWYESASGHAGHHYWLWTRSGDVAHSGAWKPVLTSAGYYEISVMVPPLDEASRKARYRIRTADGWATRVRSHRKHAGRWVSLGVHRLTTTPIVKLVDATGEPATLERRLGYDAVRFEPTAEPIASVAATRAEPGS
jgi:subtilisin family serine protease